METTTKRGTEEGAAALPAEDGPSQGAEAPSAPNSIPVDWEGLARASAHPLRVSILEVLGIDAGRVLSPSDLSAELQVYLSKLNYHVTELHKAGLIRLVRTRPGRGATEHFYRPA